MSSHTCIPPTPMYGYFYLTGFICATCEQLLVWPRLAAHVNFKVCRRLKLLQSSFNDLILMRAGATWAALRMLLFQFCDVHN